MGNAENFTAINDYFQRTEAATPEAKSHKDAWNAWYPTLSWFDKNMSDAKYDEARARRDLFNLSNAKTQQELADVQHSLATGQNEEAMRGESPAVVEAARARVAETAKALVTKGAKAAEGTRATLKQGSKGDAVSQWQTIVGVKADGNFGPGTAAATKAWQKTHGLKQDGVVGPQTWSVALATPVQQGDETLPVPGPRIAAALPTTVVPNPKATSSTPQYVAPKTTSKTTVSKNATASAKVPVKSSSGAAPVITVPPTVEPGVMSAGMLGSVPSLSTINKLPTWAKWTGGLVIGGTALLTFLGFHDNRFSSPRSHRY